jgi:hypothetical protein
MKDKSKTFTWDWEDGETGEIRTLEIAMPDLDRDYDPSESREILLDRKLDLDNVEKPDWIEIIPPKNPTDGPAKRQQRPSRSAAGNDQFLIASQAMKVERRCFAPDLFDTSPLQVHTHANFCMRMFTAVNKELTRMRMQAHAIVCRRLLPTHIAEQTLNSLSQFV